MDIIRIGGVPEHFNYPWHYAQEEGIFFDSEIQLTWNDYPEGTGAMVADLRENKLDMAVLLTEGAITAIANDLNARIIQFYVQSPLNWGIHTHPDFTGEMEDLRGKRYAISRKGSGSHLMAVVDAEKRGWDISNLQFVEVGNLEKATESIQNGQTDIFLWEKFTTKPLVDSGQLQRVAEVPTPWPCFVIVVRNEVLINRPKVIQKVQSGILSAIKRANKQSDLNAILSQRYSQKEEDIATWLKTVKWSTQTGIKYSTVKPVVNALYDLKVIQNQPTEQELLGNF